MTACLSGTKDEQLLFEISRTAPTPSEPDFAFCEMAVRISMPNSFPAIEQQVCANLYSTINLEPLAKLIDGDSKSRFGVDLLHFKLDLFEHSLNGGPRYGLIAQCHMYSIDWTQITDWDAKIADELLRNERYGAVSTKFAFQVTQESLKSFHRSLLVTLQACDWVGG